VYIAYVNNNVAGFITVGRKNHRADIGLIAVNKEFRGRKIGLSLIEKASQYAFLEGFEEIQVITQGENIPAMKLYSKSGFTIEETTFVYHAWRNE
jgi:dTDP-4-amino-4,6-dideoxy-D-galactose acyltransferase